MFAERAAVPALQKWRLTLGAVLPSKCPVHSVVSDKGGP